MDENLATLRTILELGWPAIVLFQCVILYRDNIKMRDTLVSYLNDCMKHEPSVTTDKTDAGSD